MNRVSIFTCAALFVLTAVSDAGTLKSFSGKVKTLDTKRGFVVVQSGEKDEKKFILFDKTPGVNALTQDGQVSVFYDEETGKVKRFVSSAGASTGPRTGSTPAKPVSSVKRSSSTPLSTAKLPEMETLTPKNIESFAARSSSARDVVVLYQSLLSNPATTDEEKELLNLNIGKWQESADKDLHRVGKEWLTKEEAITRRKESERLVNEALTVLDASTDDVAIERLKEAGKLDPDNPTAKCWEGLLLALLKRDFKGAANCFDAGLDIVPKDAAILNNLALCEIRLRKYSDAIEHWSLALAVAPESAHISQNVGRFIMLANKKALTMFRGVDERTLKKALAIYGKAKVGGESADVASGFVYVCPIVRGEEKQSAKASADPLSDIVSGYASGFVVAPEIVATNYHVVDGSTGLLITSSELSPEGSPAQVVATDEGRDLAIIRCPGLKLKPLVLSNNLNRGVQIAVFGYPQPTVLGSTLKMTDGIVTSLPDKSTSDNFLHSAIANPGNSGGPICDLTGAVVGVLEGAYRVDMPICIGIPSGDLLSLLQKNGIQAASSTQTVAMSLQDLDKSVSKSVVQIKILGTPGNKQVAGRLMLEDNACLLCDTKGEVDCPVKDCKRGKILVEKSSVVGRDLIGGNIVQNQQVEQTCPTCNATGKVKCPLCLGTGH
ncbi:trypsin-like peptidase domain-containing protein [bacterium]|nr:trypsin-like peptidase domain-containing protein [bacterium]